MWFIKSIQQREILDLKKPPVALSARGVMESFDLNACHFLLWMARIGIEEMIDSRLQNRHLALVSMICFIIIHHWLCDLQLIFWEGRNFGRDKNEIYFPCLWKASFVMTIMISSWLWHESYHYLYHFVDTKHTTRLK